MKGSTVTEQVSLLQQNWFFSALTPDDLDAILRFSSSRTLELNQALFWQGDSVGYLYLVLDGSIKLARRDRKDRTRIVEMAGAPDLLALHCLFSENGYTNTAIATQSSRVLAINAERFLWRIKQRPDLAWRVALYLSREVEDMVGELDLMTMCSASERLAAYLLALHERPERNNGGRVPRKRADLASLLSLSTETLCREISKFRKQGLISTDGSGFTVLEPEQLRGVIQPLTNE